VPGIHGQVLEGLSIQWGWLTEQKSRRGESFRRVIGPSEGIGLNDFV
jgi:hypothetical protein